MPKRIVALGTLLVMLWGGAALAQTVDTKPTLIQFKLKEIGGTPTLQVGPRAAGVCKNPHPEKCPDSFELRWIGAKKYNAETLRIQFDDAAAAKACFGGDAIDLTAARGQQTVRVKVDSSCNLSGSKKALFFTVSCLDSAGKACAGVAPVDPGVMIEAGRP